MPNQSLQSYLEEVHNKKNKTLRLSSELLQATQKLQEYKEKCAALEKQNKELKQLLIDCDSLSIVRESLNEATEKDEQNYYAEIEYRLTEALK